MNQIPNPSPEGAPEAPWVAALRQAAARDGLEALSEPLGYSVAVLSSVLAGTYRGDLERVSRAVEDALMHGGTDGVDQKEPRE